MVLRLVVVRGSLNLLRLDRAVRVLEGLVLHAASSIRGGSQICALQRQWLRTLAHPQRLVLLWQLIMSRQRWLLRGKLLRLQLVRWWLVGRLLLLTSVQGSFILVG